MMLKKAVWTDQDFDLMDWHDATMHAIGVLPQSFELALDIDYIVRWVRPEEEGKPFTFWVSPATLVFEGVQDVMTQFQFQYIQSVTVQEFHRTNPQPMPTGGLANWDWRLELNEGSVTFRAHGFKQYFRAEPVLKTEQDLSIDERRGLSFGRTIDH